MNSRLIKNEERQKYGLKVYLSSSGVMCIYIVLKNYRNSKNLLQLKSCQ